MTDYQIQPNTRRCAASGRELKPGEQYYSVLLDEGGQFVRKDYAAEAWSGPPGEAFSFWAGRVPLHGGRKRPPIDDDMLLECFLRLDGRTDAAGENFRYVLALLLMRRKRLRFEEARNEDGREWLVLRCPRTGVRCEVANPSLTDEEMAAVQDDIFQALGWE